MPKCPSPQMPVHEACPLPNSAPHLTLQGSGLPLLAAADLQHQLLVASNDMARLQDLLRAACDALVLHFCGASGHLQTLLQRAHAQPEFGSQEIRGAMAHLAGAITAMQFQDIASQLLAHTTHRLRSCAARMRRDAVGGGQGGSALVNGTPLRPNPVTQHEMDAGLVELF